MIVKELIALLEKENPEEEACVALNGTFDSVKSVQRGHDVLFINGDTEEQL